MLSFIVRLAAFAVGSLIGKWLALDLPDIIRERQHKKENVASAAARIVEVSYEQKSAVSRLLYCLRSH